MAKPPPLASSSQTPSALKYGTRRTPVPKISCNQQTYVHSLKISAPTYALGTARQVAVAPRRDAAKVLVYGFAVLQGFGGCGVGSYGGG